MFVTSSWIPDSTHILTHATEHHLALYAFRTNKSGKLDYNEIQSTELAAKVNRKQWQINSVLTKVNLLEFIQKEEN